MRHWRQQKLTLSGWTACSSRMLLVLGQCLGFLYTPTTPFHQAGIPAAINQSGDSPWMSVNMFPSLPLFRTTFLSHFLFWFSDCSFLFFGVYCWPALWSSLLHYWCHYIGQRRLARQKSKQIYLWLRCMVDRKAGQRIASRGKIKLSCLFLASSSIFLQPACNWSFKCVLLFVFFVLNIIAGQVLINTVR